MDMNLQLIQELIPGRLMHVAEVLTEEVEALAGDRYKRNGKPGHVRWAKQWGLVYIGEQKLPIICVSVQRIWNSLCRGRLAEPPCSRFCHVCKQSHSNRKHIKAFKEAKSMSQCPKPQTNFHLSIFRNSAMLMLQA